MKKLAQKTWEKDSADRSRDHGGCRNELNWFESSGGASDCI